MLITSVLLYSCAPALADHRTGAVTPAKQASPQATPSRPSTSTTLVASATPTQTLTVTQTLTPTPTPTQDPTATFTPWPTVDLSRFPTPPDVGAGQDHFFLARPAPPGGAASASSLYRFGSTYENRLATHHGIDLGASAGSPVLAVASGVIFYAGPDSDVQFGPHTNFYGNLVVLQLAESWQGHPVYTLYGHLNEIAVQTGQTVSEGELVGQAGSTGIALGPHLHLEVRLDSPDSYWAVYNPELWFRPIAGRGALAIRLVDASGRYVPGVRVSFICADRAYRFVDTYWDPGVNPDPGWGDNGAQTDIPAGRCAAEAAPGGQTLAGSVVVEPGRTALLVLSP